MVRPVEVGVGSGSPITYAAATGAHCVTERGTIVCGAALAAFVLVSVVGAAAQSVRIERLLDR
ncbi:MAG TPA: hypothetical protein DIU48_10630, partial [Acidobacteria bacterium]|nr:hypothetical protein [Acidobacteriota bacterium]